jgi:hypothetical protein
MKRQFPPRWPPIMGRAGRDWEDGVLPTQRPVTPASTRDLCVCDCGRRVRAKARRGWYAASQAIPAAVLCCCTIRPGCSNFASDLWS